MLQRRHLAWGAAAATATVVLYLGVVILATPTFDALVTVELALQRNGLVMGLVALGTGALTSLALAARDRGCEVQGADTAGASGGAFGVFASLFALSSVGCCGLFVFWMSLVFGAGAATALVQWSGPLTAVGLLVMAASIGVLVHRLRQDPGGAPVG